MFEQKKCTFGFPGILYLLYYIIGGRLPRQRRNISLRLVEEESYPSVCINRDPKSVAVARDPKSGETRRHGCEEHDLPRRPWTQSQSLPGVSTSGDKEHLPQVNTSAKQFKCQTYSKLACRGMVILRTVTEARSLGVEEGFRLSHTLSPGW